MRLIFNDDVVQLESLGYDAYSQPVLSKKAVPKKVAWSQEESTVTMMANFPIPQGTIFWYGTLEAYNTAVRNQPSGGINLWIVKQPGFQKDVTGRVAYYTGTLSIYQQTNLAQVP